MEKNSGERKTEEFGEQSDREPVRRLLVKRRQESEPALISVIFTFLCQSSERSEIPLVEKRERRENCQSTMFDDERLNPHGVGNLPHNKKQVVHIWSQKKS